MSLWADRLAEVWAPPRCAGSGVVVGTDGVLTARHVVEQAAGDDRPVVARVVRPGGAVGTWVPMTVAWEGDGWDLALLRVDHAAAEAGAWLAPGSGAVEIVDLGHAAAPGCEATGFPHAEVARDPSGAPVRQSEQIVGTVLPAGQGKPPVRPDRPLVAGRWMPLDVATATPGAQEQWGGMSGAAVALPDGGLTGLVIAAEQGHQERRLYVLPLAAALAGAEGFADALSACTGAPAAARARGAATWERLLAPACLGGDGRPAPIGAAGDLGAFGVKASDVPGEPPYLRYVPRDEDETLRRALRDAVAEHRMLLVVGGSASGKSRSAAEAARELLAGHRLVRPQAGRLHELAEAPLGDLVPALVWLDDLQAYAHEAFGASLQRLLGAGLPVVGTIRRAELAVLDAPGDLRDPTGEALADPRLVRRVNWRTAWSAEELARLRDRTASADLLAAADGGTPPGAYCVAGPALLRRLQRARDDEDHPARYWFVRTVLDWHRTGTKRAMPVAEAARLAAQRAFPHGPADPAHLDAALAEALRPEFTVPPSSPPPALLTRSDTGLRVHDYVLDDDQRRAPAAVTDDVWTCAIAHASEDDLAGITMAAFAAGRRDRAAAAAQPLADAGYAGAMFNLGIVAWHDDDLASARAWWERAAAGGMPSAMVNLGMMVREEDPGAARAWYEQAAASGNDTAMTNLGALLRDGDPDAARTWFRRAAELGNPNAMVGLGALDVDADPDAARAWFRRAADAGSPAGMYNLALLLGDEDPASRGWYERAAEAGHRDAMARLGVLAARADEPAVARAWLERAAEAGHRDAMFNLGVVCEDDDPEASHMWFERAAAAGDPDAAARLAGS